MARPPRRPRAIAPGLLLALALIAGACGYRFTPQGAELPGGVRSLYVPVFENHTAEPGVEAWFTEAMREELARVGREGGKAADAIALGAVTEVSDGPAIASNTALDGELPKKPISMRVQATATVKIEQAGRTLGQTTVSGSEDYLPGDGGASVLEGEANRRMALRRLAAALMREALERLSTGF